MFGREAVTIDFSNAVGIEFALTSRDIHDAQSWQLTHVTYNLVFHWTNVIATVKGSVLFNLKIFSSTD